MAAEDSAAAQDVLDLEQVAAVVAEEGEGKSVAEPAAEVPGQRPAEPVELSKQQKHKQQSHLAKAELNDALTVQWRELVRFQAIWLHFGLTFR